MYDHVKSEESKPRVPYQEIIDHIRSFCCSICDERNQLHISRVRLKNLGVIISPYNKTSHVIISDVYGDLLSDMMDFITDVRNKDSQYECNYDYGDITYIYDYKHESRTIDVIAALDSLVDFKITISDYREQFEFVKCLIGQLID
jgi:hypothetical protein